MSFMFAQKTKARQQKSGHTDITQKGVQTTPITGAQPQALSPFNGSCIRYAPFIQPKLRIGQPDDKYEQEADQVAEQVMRAPKEAPLGYMHEPREEGEEFSQRKQIGDRTSKGDHSLATQINSLTGGGQPLPESAQSYFESLLHHDFSQVRVHTDSKAAKTAKSLNAKAFTLGKDVVFDVDQYVPHSPTGKRLLAHELTHVVQQGIAGGQDHTIHTASPTMLLQRKPNKKKSGPRSRRRRRLEAAKKINVAIERIRKALFEGLVWEFEAITKKGCEFTFINVRVAESMAKRQRRLKQLLKDLIQFTIVLRSKPVPRSWFSPQVKFPAGSFEGVSSPATTIVNFGSGPAWEDPFRLFVNWQLGRRRNAGVLYINLAYMEDAPKATRKRGVPREPLTGGVSAGIWIIVPDPDNRPLDYRRFRLYDDWSVVSDLFEVWEDDFGFFYYIHNNKKHYLPEYPS